MGIAQLAWLLAVAASPGIPSPFWGEWSFDEAACANANEVRMIVRNEGYTREEIDAVVDTISVMGNAPLRLRMTVSASAEGGRWTEVEEWTLLSANRFVSHSEGDPRTTHYVKCQPTGS